MKSLIFELKSHRLRIFWILPLFVVFAFQNCSQQGVRLSEEFSSVVNKVVTSSGGGDGSGFEGKLFVRTLPTTNCSEDQNLSEQFKDVQQYFQLNDQNQSSTIMIRNGCRQHPMNFQGQDLSTSKLQSQVVLYQDGLFYNPSDVLRHSNEHIESWCRSNTESGHRLEFIVKQNYVADATWTRIWRQDSNSVIYNSDFTTTERNVTKDYIKYQAHSFNLQIQLSESDSGTHSFPGTVRFLSSNGEEESTVTCHLGGVFDGMIWPSVLVDSGNIFQFYKLQGNDFLYLSKDVNQNQRLLYRNQIFGTSDDILQSTMIKSVFSFQVIDQGQKVILLADTIKSTDKRLFLYDFQKKEVRSLSQELHCAIRSVDELYFLSSDEKFIVYKDCQQVLLSKSDQESRYLKSVNIETGQIVQLHPNLDVDLEPTIYLPLGLDRVLFQISGKIFTNDYLGKELNEIHLPVVSGAQIIDIYQNHHGEMISELFAMDRRRSRFDGASSLSEFQSWMNNHLFWIFNIQGQLQTWAWNFAQNKWTLMGDGLCAMNMTGFPFVGYGFNIMNQPILCQNSSVVKLQGTAGPVWISDQNGDSLVIQTNKLLRETELVSFDPLDGPKVLYRSTFENFLSLPVGLKDRSGFFVWQYQIEKNGFNLLFVNSFGSANNVPGVFLKGQVVIDFRQIGTSSWSLVKVAPTLDLTVSERIDAMLGFLPTGVQFDLYLVSLNGQGAKKLNPVGSHVQTYWFKNEDEVNFAVGSSDIGSASFEKIYIWKSKDAR
jgi:hypothetical protein